MEKLIQKYNEECSLESKKASILWRGIQIVIIGLFVILELIYQKLSIYFVGFIILTIFTIILWLICNSIKIKYITNKLNIKNISYKNIKELLVAKEKVNDEIERFQKNWITQYCKKNKINTIEKLKIIREEISKRQNKTKYLNPVIIGTLLVAIWEKVVQKIYEISGLINCAVICIILAIIVSMFVTWLCKEWKEQMKFLNEFSKYSGMSRLEELLIYEILKTKK